MQVCFTRLFPDLTKSVPSTFEGLLVFVIDDENQQAFKRAWNRFGQVRKQAREAHLHAYRAPPTTRENMMTIHLTIEVSICPAPKLASLVKRVGWWVLNELAGEAFIHLARYALERVLAFLG